MTENKFYSKEEVCKMLGLTIGKLNYLRAKKKITAVLRQRSELHGHKVVRFAHNEVMRFKKLMEETNYK